MPRSLSVIALCAAVFTVTGTVRAAGHLVVAGGGKADDRVLKRALELAGGPEASVVILPQASSLPDTGSRSAEMWRSLGAISVTVASSLSAGPDRDRLKSGALIWMPGGEQTRLMRALEAAEIPALLRERYQKGAVIGGTSAGAAVMSALMITGEADLQSITAQATQLASGLGLWSEVIVDQHFLKRQRFNRLMSAVLDHPDKIGVGIDEGAAVIVSTNGWEVWGGKVLVIDARARAASGSPVGQAQLHVLDAGAKWKP